MSLVSANDFTGLPLEPEARWLQLRDLVEKRLDERFDMNNGGNDTYDSLEYVQILTVAAEELEIGELGQISPSNIREDFDPFRAGVAALATRLSLRLSGAVLTHSVELARPTRKKILAEIENLRATINNSDLPEAQKDKAAKAIDKLQILVIAPRTDIERAGYFLSIIGALAVGATGLLADLPAATGTISALLGADKLEEEKDNALIEGVRKRLEIEDHRESSNENARERMDHEAGDEIPF